MKKDVILEEIETGLSWKERIFVHIFSKIFIKIYHKTRIGIINKLMQF